MSRLMSVTLTTKQVRERTKTVTRRLGWTFLKPGTRLTLCPKVRGRRPGEALIRITDVEVIDIRRERLDAITAAEVAAEGFPDWSPAQFIDFFCRTHRGMLQLDDHHQDRMAIPMSSRRDGSADRDRGLNESAS